MKRTLISSVVVGIALFAINAASQAADITLKLIAMPNGNHKYYHKLLEESLKAAGHSVHVITIDDVPQPRIALYLDQGEITLHWFLQTRERDSKYVAVDHKLTQGLVGRRVLLIAKGNEAVYENVKTLDDFKALGKVAGMGQGWFDVDVWKANGLKVLESGGDWKKIYPMLASKSRGIDYFARGANEIAAEAIDNPTLAIEPKLLLVYPRDVAFYLSKPNAALKPIVEAALVQAEKSGLQKKLIAEFFGPSIAALDLKKRVVINLANPTNN